MKTLCHKPGKGGKIHPSPVGGGNKDPIRAALRLLPAAIFALTTILCPEDQQVLAYLVTHSLQGPTAAPHPEQLPLRERHRHAHPPAIGCDCFNCYTSFWSRWDCSPNRELIHDAIEAFEDHLTATESSSSTPLSSSSTPPSSSKRRDKGKRRVPPPSPMSPNSLPQPLAPKKVDESFPPLGSLPAPPPLSLPPAPEAITIISDYNDEKVPEDPSAVEAKVETDKEEEEEEQKQGWADMIGILILRLWGIWSLAVESFT